MWILHCLEYCSLLVSKQITAPSPSPTVRQSEDIWYDDGNIVLIAEDMAFKVHRSILSRSSEVFRDMFALATPDFSGYSPVVTTCPVVHLSDTANEIETLLGIMYSQGNK